MVGRIAAAAAGLVTGVLLWFPSAAIGIAAYNLLGYPTYLTIGFAAPYVAASLALLVVPAGALWISASTIGMRTAAVIAGLVVVLWQAGWLLIALLSGSDQLIAWPAFASPAEPEPWDASAVFATGLAMVGALAGAATWRMSRAHTAVAGNVLLSG
jgi:hypothetical protein